MAETRPTDVAPSHVAPSDAAPSDVAPSHAAASDVAPSHAAPSHAAASDVAPSDTEPPTDPAPPATAAPPPGAGQAAPGPWAGHPDLPRGGLVRPVTRWGTPVMHRPQQPVTEFDDALRALVADMVATMYAADGVGLAACQIGVDRAVFVFDCPDEDGTRHAGVVCNPELSVPEGRDRQLEEDEEGCLSYPGAFVPCARPDHAEVTGQDLDGGPVRVAGNGLLARCLQHETDHCRGIVFGDRLNRRSRKRLAKQHDEAVEGYPDGWPASPAPA